MENYRKEWRDKTVRTLVRYPVVPAAENLLSCRDSAAEKPFTPFLKSLKPLSSEECDDEYWRFPRVVVFDNAERCIVNLHQVRRFAAIYNQLRLRWRIPEPLDPASARIKSNVVISSPASYFVSLSLYEELLWQSFVYGASCILLQNIQKHKKLSHDTANWRKQSFRQKLRLRSSKKSSHASSMNNSTLPTRR